MRKPGSSLPTLPTTCAWSKVCVITLGLASVMPYHCVRLQPTSFWSLVERSDFNGAAAFIKHLNDEKSASWDSGSCNKRRASVGTTFRWVTVLLARPSDHEDLVPPWQFSALRTAVSLNRSKQPRKVKRRENHGGVALSNVHLSTRTSKQFRRNLPGAGIGTQRPLSPRYGSMERPKRTLGLGRSLREAAGGAGMCWQQCCDG